MEDDTTNEHTQIFIMKAARYHGQRDIRIEEIAIPSPKDNEVLVEVEWCGICGSDLHEYTSGTSHDLRHDFAPSLLADRHQDLRESPRKASPMSPQEARCR